MPTKFQNDPARWRSVQMDDLGKCPCGGRIGASAKDVSVVHSVPPCKAFEDLEPDEFLTYVRRSRGIPDSALEADTK
jgi:hypothetical protein